jgi:hypothetical protein
MATVEIDPDGAEPTGVDDTSDERLDAWGHDMAEETPGEAVTTAGEPDVDPTVVDVPDPAYAESQTASVTSDASGESSQPELDATPETTPDTPDVHRYRIMHEISSLGSEMVHSVITSAPMILEDALKFLAETGIR